MMRLFSRIYDDRVRSRWLFLILISVISACGGGGSSGSNNNATPPLPAPPPTPDEMAAASAFASQATFGMPYEGILTIAETGTESWLDQQFNLPVSDHKSIVDNLLVRRDAGEFEDVEEDIELLVSFRRYAWWHRAISAPDVLRQRLAFALSQIFVVSDNVDILLVYPYALTTYVDLLLNHSFGNYRDLLKDVALHPAMGVFLSHVNNRKADPVNNTFPDENFAREVMQLFSIGLFELNIDGSLKTDANGDPIPTYDNDDIREFAKIFTGLSYGGPSSAFGNNTPFFRGPMEMFDEFHEPGTKQLLGGISLPAGQSGQQDIDDAIDNLFNHPNVGPFIARRLIQQLVSSNPPPAYIQRVAEAFNDNGTGLRGDMKAVVKAVLLDPAAATSSANDAGKLREPVERFLSMVRQFNPESDDDLFFNGGYILQFLVRQHPLSSPSVFNFFLPDHIPAGELADADLNAPELQITTSTTITGMSNIVDFVINADFISDVEEPFSQTRLNFEDYIALADDVDELIDRLDLVLTHGELSPATRTAVRDILVQVADLNFRVRTAIYMILVSPDYAIRS